MALAATALLVMRPAAAENDGTVALSGDVEHPAKLTAADLRKLPPSTEAVFYHTGRGGVSVTFTGASLWAVLQQATPKSDPAIKNQQLRRYLVVKAGDGYVAVIAYPELDPAYGGQLALLAYEQDGKPLDDKAGPVRLVMPNDKDGGRDVMNVTQIELHTVTP